MASMPASTVFSIFNVALQTGAFSTTSAIANWFTSASAASQAVSALSALAGRISPAQMMAILLVSSASTTAPLSTSGINLSTLVANVNAVASYIATQAAASGSPIFDLVERALVRRVNGCAFSAVNNRRFSWRHHRRRAKQLPRRRRGRLKNDELANRIHQHWRAYDSNAFRRRGD